MSEFTVYPAIDLRNGQVVRLMQGDPDQQTVYGNDPASVARRWLDAGSQWLHVVNLDGSFENQDNQNQEALQAILEVLEDEVQVQFGGGLRTMADVAWAVEVGVRRIILGTAAVIEPWMLEEALQALGPERVSVAIDARDGFVKVRGWQEGTDVSAVELAQRVAGQGVTRINFTNILHDGAGMGVDIQTTQEVAEKSGLAVVASGGVASLEDIKEVKVAGFDGVIVGRALYEEQIDLKEALAC
ncbi:MAG: 1-(5-phosphoribosyl)-5-[(5-phosphoribosylamino)methylideneamino] imidazole-4-carboxamide isomerase [Chloroflexi bacterium]|nr:MAG: 1-(5-phosphoribosyl)-5-[(5-phosphoribosylamino)methylideneamino] imidazole-4-carboxamide isomerase [Chloroflexota bacterium]MBL1192896.1 1-(5-phosphoribosyl)-5-[(5-phosphoribosylamino)methylideneamino] imidazole-4-carboxamide isomerase [Chloroflexota bacterium]NOH10188.1 1-(5-phosphoribosyl)-5-[(5-phosphoribosylamino)methylideneamino]imidazole-4-carboxamide isomerase [Chloroflexota bacterium]